MHQNVPKSALFAAIAMAALWLSAGYLLPLCLPFLLGLVLALTADPMVKLLNSKTHLPRCAATAFSVSAVCVLSTAAMLLFLALLIRQMRSLNDILPQMETAIQQGLNALQIWLANAAGRLPGSIGTVATGLLESVFADSASLLGQAASKLPQIASDMLGGFSEALLGIVTGIISGFMISARLPEIRQWIHEHLPESWHRKYRPAIQSLRKALRGWMLAELKLAGIAWALLSIGFLLLRIENTLLLASLVTIVDAFPVLGVGTVLVPWSVVCLLQGNTARGIGLLGLYAVIWLVRSVLEPKLVGKGIGLDPLVTLAAIYVGFRLWGILGMLLAPILALTAAQVVKHLQK